MEGLRLPNTLCRKVDVVDRDAVMAAVKEAETKFGPTDLLINNAGVMLLEKMENQDPKEWDTMIDVNVRGVLNAMHAVVSQMTARQGGTIVNISSVAGRKLFGNHTAYCGTKFFVHTVSEGLREEVAGRNVRVSVVAPGAVSTELLSHTTNDGIKAGYEDWKTQIGGALSPASVVGAIKYIYEQPQEVHIREVVLTATKQGP